MRTQQEMMELVCRIAQGDDRIRAVYLNGSRVNPHAPRDLFQDFDVVYVVTQTDPYIGDQRWLSGFGELLMRQEPDGLDSAAGEKRDFSRRYAYLMLFTDGNRIDLSLETVEEALSHWGDDSLTKLLLDKDGVLPGLPEPGDGGYWVKPPTPGQYDQACNDFWWCLQNVAKGLWRGELPYAKSMLDTVVRERLDSVVGWWIGAQHGFQVSPGKMGKYYQRYLPAELWERYKMTYSGPGTDETWNAVFAMCELFRALAAEVAERCRLCYPREDDENMSFYLRAVRALPAHATDIFPEEGGR